MHKVCECQLVFTGTKAGISERLQGHQLRCDRQVAKGEICCDRQIHHQHLPHPPGEDDALFGFCHFHLISADRSSCVLSGHFLSPFRSVPADCSLELLRLVDRNTATWSLSMSLWSAPAAASSFQRHRLVVSLVGGKTTPLKNMKVRGGYNYCQYMQSHKSYVP